MKQIKWGAGIGSMSGLSTYLGVCEYAKNHGLDTFRVFNLFDKGWSEDKIVAKIKSLTFYNTAKVLIGFNSFPYEYLSNYDLSILTPKQQSMAQYTNRFYPTDIEDFKNKIMSLLYKFQVAGIMNSLSFEIMEEPDSTNKFWGTFDEFKSISLVLKNILKPYGRPIYHADFTSSLMRNSSYKNKEHFLDYIETSSIFNDVIFSHSFYWEDSGGTFNPVSNTYPNRTFSDSIISEYNMYIGYNEGSTKDLSQNSSIYVNKLCALLKFIYDKPISRIFVHPLCDYNLSADGQGKMGIYKRNVTGDNKVYFTIKPSGTMLYQVMDVVKFGYSVSGDNIVGIFKSIVFDQNSNWTITNN